VDFLSEEWLAVRLHRGGAQQWLPDMDVRIQHVVRGEPDDMVIHYYDEIVGGRLVGSGRGTLADPDVTITNYWDDELAVLRGDKDMFDVLLAGRVDVDGDHGRLFLMVPTLVSPAFAAFARELVAEVGDRAELPERRRLSA
jgi:hypothetical protein